MIRDRVNDVKSRLFLLSLIQDQYLDSCLSGDDDLRQQSVSRISVLLETFLQSLELTLEEIDQEASAIDSAIIKLNNYDRN